MERLRVTSQGLSTQGGQPPAVVMVARRAGAAGEARCVFLVRNSSWGEWGLELRLGWGGGGGAAPLLSPCWPGLHPQRRKGSSGLLGHMLALQACCCHCVHRASQK